MSANDLRTFWSKNKKVGAAVRAPINAKSLLKKLEGVAGHGQLKALVTAYENIDPANDPDCSIRMTALHDIDAAVCKWFKNTAVTSLSEVKGAKAMAALLKKSEQAHEQLVDATWNDPNVVPFDTSKLAPNEIVQRTAVWRAVVDGTAQVKLGGSDKFQKKTRAQVAKMLQTETGFNILNYLGTPKTTSPGATDRIVLGDTLPPDLATQNHMTAVDQEVSYAKELTPQDSDKDLQQGVAVDGTEDPNEYPSLTSTDQLQAAIFAGKKGVIVGGKKYSFAKGSGSFVKTVPPRAGDEDSDTAGNGNTEVITPAYITLAHELGHAVNIRAGATTRNHPELMVALCKSADPTLTDQDIEDRWSNGEEYFNISNIENGMRMDCGLPLRAAHKPRTALMKMARIAQLKQQAANYAAKDEAVAEFPEATELATFMNANKGKTDDEKIVAQIVKKTDRLANAATDRAIEDFKRNDLLEYRKTLDDVFNKKRPELGDDDALVARYNRIDDALRNDMDTLIAVGTKNWKAIKDDIRNLRFDLAKAAAKPD